jgi:uncharacterized membrane protein
MRAITEFTKTTIIGGILIIMPLYLSSILLFKALGAVRAAISPVTNGLPNTLHFPQLIACLLLIFICFVCGIVVRTSPGLRAKNAIERTLLEKIPGYTLIRGLAGRIVGKEDEQSFSVVLVEIEDALVPAFLVEDCGDDQCAVFVPSIPTPAAGSIYILAKSRVHAVDVPFTHAVGVISKWGAGSKELLNGMKRAQQRIFLSANGGS